MKCDVHGVEGCKAACCAIWLEKDKGVAELHEPPVMDSNMENKTQMNMALVITLIVLAYSAVWIYPLIKYPWFTPEEYLMLVVGYHVALFTFLGAAGFFIGLAVLIAFVCAGRYPEL